MKDYDYVYCVCRHTHTSPLYFYLVDPLNFRSCIQGDSSLRKAGVGTAPIVLQLVSSGLTEHSPPLQSLPGDTRNAPRELFGIFRWRERTTAVEIFSPQLIQFENEGVVRLQYIPAAACASFVHLAAMGDYRTMICAQVCV